MFQNCWTEPSGDHQLQLLEIDPTSVEEPFLEQAAALNPELVAALVPDQAAHAEGSRRRCPQASRTQQLQHETQPWPSA